jgi:predicted nucleic acid-binding protein
MAHRLMTLEAAAQLGRPLAGLSNWLKRHPAEVQQLTRHQFAHDELALIGIVVLTVDGRQVSLAADISTQFGLLTNDALLVAVMRDHNLTDLASNDADFDRVPGLTRYAPT